MIKLIKKIMYYLLPSLFCKNQPIIFNKIRGFLVTGNKNIIIGKNCVINNTKIKKNTKIESYVRLIGHPKINIGEKVYINCFTMMLGDIEIQDGVLISQFVNIWGRSHKYENKNKLIWRVDSKGQGYKEGKIIIKEGSWIGPHTTIFRGVTIGKGAVIGANSVVTKDIPDFAVAFGAPAKVVKYRK